MERNSSEDESVVRVEAPSGDELSSQEDLDDEGRKGEGNGGGDRNETALERILESLERIEYLLAGKQSHARHLENRSMKQSRAPVRSLSISDIPISRFPNSSGDAESIAVDFSSEYADSIIVERHCSVNDIPDYERLVGRGRHLPKCDQLDILFTETALERYRLSEAIKICEDLQKYITAMEQSGNLARNFIMDFAFNIHGARSRVWVPANLIETLGSQLAKCLYYVRTPGTVENISDPIPHHLEWGRLIVFEGLTTVRDPSKSQKALLPPFVRTDNATGHTRTPLVDIFDLHLSCVDPSPNWDFNIQFQITFYEMLRQLPIHDTWEHGILYPRADDGRNTVFRKACLTFFILEGVQWADGPKRKASWSIVVCAPSGFFGEIHYSDMFRPRGGPLELTLTAQGGVVTYHEAILQFLSICVPIIVDRWRAIWKELCDLIESDGYSTFMNPREYVHLLYDEASFPRSRFYFWAIGCLSAFEENITTNIRQLKAFRKVHVEDVRFARRPDAARRMDPIVGESDVIFKDLEDIADQIRKKLAALHALRDGLFSASAVMESRQSRVLGENVRLLTFVSICFLPLGLVVAFWSVPDVNETWPGIRTPICASLIGGIITYLIVFNLDILELSCRTVLSGPRNYLIEKMSSAESPSLRMPRKIASEAIDPSKLNGNIQRDFPSSTAQRWQSRAKDFEVFPRPDKNPKPSDWWLLLFAVQLPFTLAYDKLSKLWRTSPSNLPALPLHRITKENRDVEFAPTTNPELGTVPDEREESRTGT